MVSVWDYLGHHCLHYKDVSKTGHGSETSFIGETQTLVSSYVHKQTDGRQLAQATPNTHTHTPLVHLNKPQKAGVGPRRSLSAMF